MSCGRVIAETLSDLADVNRQEHILETTASRNDGARFWVEVSVSRLTVRQRQQFTLIVRDVSERKRAEKTLAESNQQIVDLAHRAGKAEIATCVIHNVGNVLTNVNVLASAVTSKLRNSRLTGLGKAAALLESNQQDIVSFIRDDQRGRQLPAYFIELARCWEKEAESLLADLNALADNLQHANKIVDAQQDFAGSAGVTESTSLTELMDKGLAITVAGLERHSVAVETDFQELPIAQLDRHKLLQVLVNLITNAKEAFVDRPVEGRKITVRLYSKDEDRFKIEVSDNGMGIDRDNMNRVFANGFTTKPDGHGFGLHYSALAVSEMGGCLTVQSDGVGRGATFVIDMPLQSVMAEVTA